MSKSKFIITLLMIIKMMTNIFSQILLLHVAVLLSAAAHNKLQPQTVAVRSLSPLVVVILFTIYEINFMSNNDAIYPVLATNYNNILFSDLFLHSDLKKQTSIIERCVIYRNIEMTLICNFIPRIQKQLYKKNLCSQTRYSVQRSKIVSRYLMMIFY
jgi:hypothetical protein